MGTRNTGRINHYFLLLIWAVAFLFPIHSFCLTQLQASEQKKDEPNDFPADLTELSIEDLMDIEVTTFSRKAQKLSNTAAAVFVITQEDIRRSGAVNIPELLRMVPGLQVARIDANKWAISSRGFNGRFANKLLVLMDGRSLYSPIFSGVLWDAQDTLIEDIDRIEIIRGPGASTWGANAVNGVINIITKKAADTRGGLVSAGVGTEEKSFGSIRYGMRVSEDADVRMYAKYADRDEAVYASGEDALDDWNLSQGGFRSDWQISNKNALTVQGDIFNGDSGQEITLAAFDPPYSKTFDDQVGIYGGNLLTRWMHTYSATSAMTTSVYYDRAVHNEFVARLTVETMDLDFQHQFIFANRHEIVWGGGYRLVRDRLESSFNVAFDPEKEHTDIFSAFIQDDIIISPNQWRLTLGSKFEHNDYTGAEIQPTARILWTPNPTNSIWGSVSRAVRTPARAERNTRFSNAVIPPGQPGNPGTLPLVISASGNDAYDSEDLLAFEIGYRVAPIDKLSFDTAVFYNRYDNLRTAEAGTVYTEPQPIPDRVILPMYISNMMNGETYGFELAADWRWLNWWRLQTSYTYLKMNLELDSGSTSFASVSTEDESPCHQVSFRSSTDLTKNLELDIWARFVDRLPAQDVDRYVTMDARLGWHPIQKLEISLVGRNLLENHHSEFKPEHLDTASTEVERSAYVKVTWSF
ncbi:MAG: TonB-dependent receptor [Pseudomonadota bacterium]